MMRANAKLTEDENESQSHRGREGSANATPLPTPAKKCSPGSTEGGANATLSPTYANGTPRMAALGSTETSATADLPTTGVLLLITQLLGIPHIQQ